MHAAKLALVGDYSPKVTAHAAIPRALARIQAESDADLEWAWIPTRQLHDAAHDLADFSAIWLVPASPYENPAGALGAIQFARETHRPFLGTCGGFQHALIEFVRDVVGVGNADHAETNPASETLIVVPLSCSLVEKSDAIRFVAGSLVQRAYRTDSAAEEYHCRYGLNPEYRATLENAGLRCTAFDEAGEVRAIELPTDIHPFFVGTLFQPERAALRDQTPPLVRAWVEAAVART